MNNKETLSLMHLAFDEANKVLCLQNGMTEADADESIEKSKVAVEYLLTEVLKRLEENNILATS